MGGRIEVVAPAAGDTRAVGAAVGRLLVPGDVVVLAGDLGAGKTTFVQGAAEALGVTEHVASPTFVLVRQYRGTVPVAHVDVYRLRRVQEVLDLGIEDLIDGGWVVFVEWGDMVEALFAESHLRVDLRASDDDRRTIALSARGGGWAPRWPELERAVSGWRAA
jgi:tRNA threonylcarbamoyladenosine biosynthesis protein TsaE